MAQATRDGQAKVVVVGLGNLLMKDDGIGVHVARALSGAKTPDHIELQVIDGGTGFDPSVAMGEADRLIIVDAVFGGGVPGDVYRFHPEDVLRRERIPASVHDLDLLSALELTALHGRRPGDIVIIGVEPGEIDWGLELTPELRGRFLQIVDAVLNEIGVGTRDK